MDTISTKKVFISYVLTSFAIFFASAAISSSNLFEANMGDTIAQLSTELLVLIQLFTVLFVNFLLHAAFYYGGLTSSPIARGLGIGTLLGVIYFFAGVLAFDFYDLNTDFLDLAGAIGGRVIEYGTGGIVTALVSVSDIQRWGLLRAI